MVTLLLQRPFSGIRDRRSIDSVSDLVIALIVDRVRYALMVELERCSSVEVLGHHVFQDLEDWSVYWLDWYAVVDVVLNRLRLLLCLQLTTSRTPWADLSFAMRRRTPTNTRFVVEGAFVIC